VGTILSNTDMIGAHFLVCDFVGANLCGSNFTRALLNHCSFSYADMTGCYMSEAHFKDADLMGTILYNAVLWNSDLSGARHLKKKNFQISEMKEQAAVCEDNPLVAFESYRTLKHYLNDKGLYEDASWAAYRELTMERKHFFETRNPRFIPSFCMDLTSGYAQKPNRVIFASLVMVLFFTTLYYLFNIPIPTAAPPATHASFVECLYFSFITFTTVGYGDFAPRAVSLFRIIACVEAFSGPFMAGLYIFTLTRRYAAG
jgi:hypothetical protein